MKPRPQVNWEGVVVAASFLFVLILWVAILASWFRLF